MNLRRIASLLAWSLLGVIAYSTLSPLDLRPHMGSSVQIERFGAFGLTGLMLTVRWRIGKDLDHDDFRFGSQPRREDQSPRAPVATAGRPQQPSARRLPLLQLHNTK